MVKFGAEPHYKKVATSLPEGSVAGVSPAERRGLGQSPIIIEGGSANVVRMYLFTGGWYNSYSY